MTGARRLDARTLATPVEGRNLSPGTLGEQLGSQPTLMVFLRHLH